MSSDLDIGPLSWVKGEIDLALERASAALTAHAANPSGKELSDARGHLHQANGALAIVGLPGISEFSDSVEQLVVALAEGNVPWSDKATEAVHLGLSTLRGYLDGLMGGELNQPLKLMPAFMALQAARGLPEADVTALFFPDLSQRPPKRDVEPESLSPDKLDARLKMARMSFERGLLKWIKGEARGVTEMKTATMMIEATRHTPTDRAFWWVALGVFEAFAANGVSDSKQSKKFAMQMGAQVKKLTEGNPHIPDRLFAEALYLVATAKIDESVLPAHIRVVRAAYRTNELIPSTAVAGADALRPQLRRMREVLSGAKDDWNKLCAGSVAALPPFHEKTKSLSTLCTELGHAAISSLIQSLATLADALRHDPSRHTETMALEVATALLVTDNALENFHRLDAEFEVQAGTIAERLSALLKGDELAPFEIPQLDAISQRAQERLLLATVAREITSNLGAVEQTLDAYFRDVSKQGTLTTLAKPLKQVEGALSMLGQYRAVEIVRESEQRIAQLAASGVFSTGDFEELAKKLSALGFFVEQLEDGANPDIDLLLNPPRATMSIAPSQEILEPSEPQNVLTLPGPLPEESHALSPLVEVQTLPDVSAPPPPVVITSVHQIPPVEDEDEDMLQIFLEEAREVMEKIASELPKLHAQPTQLPPLTTMRRSFHTLKGSGRMVGLTAFGEAGWNVEQVLNDWLHDHRAATPELLAMLDDAATLFGAWIEQLANHGGHDKDASELILQCTRLLAGDSTPSETAEPELPSLEIATTEVELALELPSATEIEIPALTTSDATVDAEVDLPLGQIVDSLEPEAIPAEPSAAELVAELEALELASDEAALAAAELEAAEIMASATVASAPEFEAAGSNLYSSEMPTDGTSALVELPLEELSFDSTTKPRVDDADSAETQPPAVERSTAEVHLFPAPPQIQIGDVSISQTLYSLYVAEAGDHLSTIQREIGVVGIPSEDIVRAAHTLSGISGTTGIEAVQHLARAIEVALERLVRAEAAPTDEQRFIFARSAGALEGMLGAIAERRMPSAEVALADALEAFVAIPLSAASNPLTLSEQSSAEPSELVPPATEALDARKPIAEIDEETPAPITAAAELPEIIEDRRTQRIEDEIDDQLLPIFLEESVDLMRSISEGVRNWRSDPGNAELSRRLQRDLHTIKGSARMVGAMGCGELFHSMESRIDHAVAMGAITSEMLDSLDVSVDRGTLMIERLSRGESATPRPAAAAPEALVSVETAPNTGENVELVTDQTKSAVPNAGGAAVVQPGTQVQLRVRADLVDKLVNETGEVAIARSRIEGEMRSIKASLLELTENVIRLRNQVREIEIQAESQMASQQAQMVHEGQFDPLEFDRFTRFQELTRMMAESVNDVSTVQHTLLRSLDGADAALAAQARLNSELSQRLMSVRMMPFDSLAERLHRVVRLAAKETGKRANLDIRGGQTGIDRSVLETIASPLEHLLRNAIAHGIELPADREASGKSAQGEITLSLAQEGNDAVINLSDDGAGLNLERIRARGLERGLLQPDSNPDEKVLANLIMEPGFSTADSVSELAGRGVGMDVVKNETESLGGRIEISTTAGHGSTFRLYLPLTLAVTQALIIQSGSRFFAIPSSMIELASELKPEAVQRVRTANRQEYLGRTYPYHYLARLLGERGAQPPPARRHWLLLVKGGSERVALEIDGLIANQEIIVKPLGPQMARVPGMAGATVLGGGEIALILNPIALSARLAALPTVDQSAATQRPMTTTQVGLAKRVPTGTVMVVDDSLTVRKITGRLLARQGYTVVTAKDGVDALEQLTEMRPDVMLVDIEMPRMDGFELSRNIRADGLLKSIPIIMITSRSADKHRNHAAEIGVNHYMGKPYDEEALLELISQYAKVQKD
jgi:chemosensory pili system protein ChpA (sensor histidine kinase/response regulator)